MTQPWNLGTRIAWLVRAKPASNHELLLADVFLLSFVPVGANRKIQEQANMTLDALTLFHTSLLMLAVGYLASISNKLDQRDDTGPFQVPFFLITLTIWFFGFVGVVTSICLWGWAYFF